MPKPKKPKPKRARRGQRWMPSTSPPPNMYDPALDAQERAAQRGYEDLTMDTERTGERSLSDYLLAQGTVGLSRQRLGEDYAQRLQDIGTQYGNLANQQTQQATAQGVSGGALAQALQKRTANMTREGTALNLQVGRESEDLDRRLGAMGVDYGRGVEDRTQGLTRAGRELGFYKQDVGQQRFYQAKGMGWAPPKNEFQKGGLWWHVQNPKKPLAQRVYTRPSGRRFTRPQFVRTLKRRRRAA